ncbi:efflux RND transporter permease subunit [Odoribacter laneus]|uniref:efflux RND transporter permease subunit n=1 Tax=Odoribacter laneus TaxID=626933 RepID=UPI003AB75CC8
MNPEKVNPVKTKQKFSSFSVILTMIALMIIGASLIPKLNIRYTPSLQQQELTLTFYWYGASARVIEQEVTSKIEGVLASIKGIQEMRSSTGKGWGQITLEIKKKENVDAIRFETATLIKQIYPHLPEKVTYPNFSTNVSGDQMQTLLSYTLNAPYSTSQIQQYAEEHILPVISRIEGINDVSIYGATPYEWEIRFHPNKCEALGLTAQDIAKAINTFNAENIVGLIPEQTSARDTLPVRVILVNPALHKVSNRNPEEQNTLTDTRIWENIPLINNKGRIIYLRDIAEIQYKEQLPNRYYRINGLNNINLSIHAEKQINALEVTAKVKEEMKKLSAHFPENYSTIIAYDSSKEIEKELNKIYVRTLMSTLILLAFVYLVSRKLRYLFLIVITLLANILLAFIFYKLFQLEIHLYSMAGITVSLGLIIDTSIIMIDHYNYYRNRKAFLAILAALLTTIGALIIVFFLPEQERANLVDFSSVIIINLTVSLFIALLFIPALVDKLPMKSRTGKKLFRSRRRLVQFTQGYGKFIRFSRRPLLKGIFLVFILLCFGIPLHLLPERLKDTAGKDRQGFFPALYNKTLGSRFYQMTLKPKLEPLLGGSLRLFTEHVFNTNYYSDPQRTRLYVRANMPEGCTVHQLNEVLLKMENFLSQYEQIETYQTYVLDYNNGGIIITFQPEFESSSFPHTLQEALVLKATDLGGATWNVYGMGQFFSNALGSGYKSNRISLSGYNYDMLYNFALQLIDSLTRNQRVSAPEIMGSDNWRVKNLNEYFLRFNFERFAQQELTPANYYDFLTQQLYRNSLQPVFIYGQQTPITLVSSENKDFDIWHLQNDIITMNKQSVKLSDLGNIEKRPSGNNIYKKNQVYSLQVAYDFLGPHELAKRVMEREIKKLNLQLPLGFKAENKYLSTNWKQQSQPYILLFLIVIIIYFICAILFESLWQPFIIILMIPISFIGVFLTFYLFQFNFDQGGFASFVLLCGIVVNAGIYLINEYNLTCQKTRQTGIKIYLKSYNHKIIPIFLTIISTILGLIPFVYSGAQEIFWFSFAIGAMGGMLFSLVALIIYLPLLMKFKPLLPKAF